jgi:nucleoside-diphosphate-sugar epimerase
MKNKHTKKRALITGATGYIGSNLVRHLLVLGWDVHIVTRPTSKFSLLVEELGTITVHLHDQSSLGMVDLLDKVKPDIIFHLASLVLVEHQANDVEALVCSNLLFSTQLVEAMALTGVKFLINSGTSWQHYNNEAYNPVNLYAATKQAFEAILAYYTEVHAIKVSTLVLFDTYGPCDPRKKLISLLWSAAITQHPLVMSPGEQMIDLVYIDDVIRAYTLAADELLHQSDSHTHYGVSSGSPKRLIDLVAEFEAATQTRLLINFGGRPYRPREVMLPWTQYRVVPGWRPQVPFSIGIQDARPSARPG